MGAWEDRVEEHDLPKALRALFTAVDAAEEREVPEEHRQKIERVRDIGFLAESYLCSQSSSLVSGPMLNQLRRQLNATATELNNWAGNGNATHLASAATNGDAVLAELGRWPTRPDNTQVDVLERRVAEVRSAAEREQLDINEALDRLRDATGTLAAQLNELTAERDQRIAELTTQVEQLEQEISGQREAFVSLRDSQTATFDKVEAERAREFTQAESARQTGYDEHLRELAGRADAAITDVTGTATLAMEQGEEKADEIIERLETLRDRAEEAAGRQGSAVLGAGFGEEAAEQKEAADQLRRYTMWALGVAVVWAAGVLFLDGNTDVNDTGAVDYIVRLPGAIVAGALAAYLGKQSGVHRKREQAARERQLQLQALPLYMAPIDDDVEEEAMVILAGGYFRPDVSSETEHGTDHSVGTERLADIFRRKKRPD